MSEVLAIVLTALAIAVVLSTYVYALRRYEVGRKIPNVFSQAKVRWPYRRNRFPLWVQAVQWICAFVVTVSFVFMMAASGSSESRADGRLRAAGLMLAMFVVAFIIFMLITEVHNRRSASHPPSGWYEDPHDPNNMRWWNGVEWCEYTFPKDRVVLDPFASTTTE
jgi:sterol desaturase/sphingolipid hydroxylase (fatty acid hydroxylase superfamily)